MRLLEACENADAKVDGKKPPGDENFGSPGGMRGGPGGTIGRLIKRLKFQAYIKRHFNLIKLGNFVAGGLTRRAPTTGVGRRIQKLRAFRRTCIRCMHRCADA